METPQKKKPKVQAAKIFKDFKREVVKDEAAKKETPFLLDVLLPLYVDGTLTRQPGRITIQADGGSWRVQLECPTEQLQTVLMVDSLTNLLVDVEKLLASGTVRWGESWRKKNKNLPVLDE